MASNRSRAAASVLAFVAVFLGSAGIAAAAGHIGGRYGGINSNGTYARIQGNSFSPGSNDCVLFSTLVRNETSSLAPQLQAGLVRCLNTPGLFGTCNHVKFVESLYGSGGACYPHGSFSNGVFHNFKVQRIGTTDYYQAYVNGDPHETLSGFPSSHANRIWAWGEYTQVNSTCQSWGGSGTINDWKKLDPSNGWVTLSGTIYISNCWSVSGISGGTWNVTE